MHIVKNQFNSDFKILSLTFVQAFLILHEYIAVSRKTFQILLSQNFTTSRFFVLPSAVSYQFIYLIMLVNHVCIHNGSSTMKLDNWVFTYTIYIYIYIYIYIPYICYY